MHCPDPSPARRIAAALLLLIGVPACASVPEALSFPDAVRLALERAPQVEARRSEAAAAIEAIASAGALPDPRLIAGVQNLPIAGTDAFALDADRMTMRRIGLSQEFPSRAKRQARRAVAEAVLIEARAQAVATRLAVQRQAADAWILLWAAERELDHLQALEQQSALAVDTARARQSGGGGSATDVLAARTAELELGNRIVAAQARIAQGRAALGRWLGAAPQSLATAAPEFGRVPVEEAALLADLERQAELLVWSAREAGAEAAFELARAQTRPDWALSGGYVQRGADADDAVWLEVSVQLPVFTRNRQDRGIAARRAEWDAVQAMREDAVRAQGARVRSLHAEWAGLREQVQRYEQQILPLAADRSRVALAAFSGGESLQAWIDARRDELSARTAHAELLGRLGRAWAELAFLQPPTADIE